MKKSAFIALAVLLWIPSLVSAQSIVTTAHNLSISGPPAGIIANTEDRICIFCHVPHYARTTGPLWNRDDPALVYTLYGSSTLNALPGQPDGSSIMCLSCHDGTIALGNIYSEPIDIDFAPITTMPITSSAYFSTDLRDDHPISFVYDAPLATADGQLLQPPLIAPPVALQATKVQCTSCHDPHKNIYTDFLVQTTQFSTICNSCHDRTYWPASTHNTSASTWNAAPPDPWPNSAYTTVGENDCSSCHWSHNSGGVPRLLKYQPEENNCLDCHNANVALTDIQTQFAKPFIHNVYGYLGPAQDHDPVEPNLVVDRHVECVDCHNPHASNATVAVAPNANGFLAGVKGINQAGNPVDPVAFEYEVCYRCHAETVDKPTSSIARQFPQNNVRLEFDPTNFSYHPVAAAGVNPNVPSLIPPLTTASIIYCTDCHASDGISPAGPHGSIYPQILKLRYETADNTPESAAAYALCYSCHDRNSILNDQSFPEHDVHIRGDDIPCSACHDAHGMSNTQTNALNGTHMINFDLSIVFQQDGLIYFEDQGVYQGECYLMCHGKKHDPIGY